MAKALSRAGYEALSLADEHGGLILVESYHDGYWTYRGCPGERFSGSNVWRPETTFTRPTLRSLFASGYLAADGPKGLIVTDVGRIALERTRASLDRKAFEENAAVPVDFALAARIFWRDGKVSFAGVSKAGEGWRNGETDDGLAVDPVVFPTEDEALSQTRGTRDERVRDAPQPPLASPCLDLYWPTPNRTAWVGNACVLVPYDTMEPVIVEVAWTSDTWDEATWGEVGAVWWVALADRSLGLLCDGIHHAEQSIPAREGLFRPRDGYTVAVSGMEWEDLPLGDLCPVDIPDERLEHSRDFALADHHPTLLKVLDLAGNGPLERLQGGFWTYGGCQILPRSPSMPLAVPTRYVDGKAIAACLEQGLLEMGNESDTKAFLTDEGRTVLGSDPGGPDPMGR